MRLNYEWVIIGSNRTFMELKSEGSIHLPLRDGSSNRTFMELKFIIHWLHLGRLSRSNRTFMELKFDVSNSDDMILYVLIAPLWN